MSADRDKLRSMVDGMSSLATIPAILKKIMDLTSSEKTDISDLEKVIKHDKAITARIIGISNSGYYGFSGKVKSISQAILILGFEMVKNLAISTSMFQNVSPEKRVRLQSMWQHSFEVAMAAGIIATKSGAAPKEAAFTAGLLHDIGRAVLFQIFDEKYFEEALPDNLLKREDEAFGATHMEVGYWFARKCGVPEECVRAIKYHHTPEMCVDIPVNSPQYNLIVITYIANLMVSKGVECFTDHCQISPLHGALIKHLNFKNPSFILNSVGYEIDKSRDELKKFYS